MMLRIAIARPSVPTRNAPESRGISHEALPMHAGIRTEREIRIAPDKKSPPTSLPSREDAPIVNPSRARVIAIGANRLLNCVT